jgi:hypothetical protein
MNPSARSIQPGQEHFLIRKWTRPGRNLGSGGGFEGDVVAERFELADVVASLGEGVDVAVVVVGAELVEPGVGVGEQVPDDHQQ